MSWKPEFQVAGEGQNWYGNGLAFATKEECDQNAKDKYSSWFSAVAWRSVESNDPVNYRYDFDNRMTVPV